MAWILNSLNPSLCNVHYKGYRSCFRITISGSIGCCTKRNFSSRKLPGGALLKDFATSGNSVLTQKEKNALYMEFDRVFIRKPKVLIVGVDVAAMIASLTFQKYGIFPDILDTRHYMHPLAPNKDRCSFIPINAQRVLALLNIYKKFESISRPIKYYARSEDSGRPIGSINFQGLEMVNKLQTAGIQLTELERVMQEIVAARTTIQSHCVVNRIERVQDGDQVKVDVSWDRYFLGQKKSFLSRYDAVFISEGTFSSSRELIYPEKFQLRGVCKIWEAVTESPVTSIREFASDQWGKGKRAGFYPVGPPQKNLLYVYGLHRLSPEDQQKQPVQSIVDINHMVEYFKDFEGPWKEMLAALLKTKKPISCTSTVVLHGQLDENPPTPGDPILMLGSTYLTMPIPNLGHDIGMAVESGYFAAISIIYRRRPIPVALAACREQFKSYLSVAATENSENYMSLVTDSMFPPIVLKWFIRRRYTDKALTEREMKLIGTLPEGTSRDLLSSEDSIAEMKDAWCNLTNEEREEIKADTLKSETSLMQEYLGHIEKQKPRSRSEQGEKH
ncbi:uncharacterized protein LOC126325815 [Schistocerca gregaria]|uniref:uncharacterized protein LOC126325815 n=1 Tax=Schistocerca gregaria TaxID=7010 RepID=UPI00211EAFF0|nr:uncharacterized protein LOC126325815 [Schistocerca gregaria]